MSNFVYEYGQLYNGLRRATGLTNDDGKGRLIPQFAAMPLSADWLYNGGQSNYADYVSPSRFGFYTIGSSLVSMACRNLYESVDPIRGAEYLDKTVHALSKMNPPRMKIQGDLASDILRWEHLSFPMMDLVVDANKPCNNEWTRLYADKANPLDNEPGICEFFGVDRYRFIARGVGIYEILRDDWYSESLVTPSLPLVQGANITSNDFFGAGGSLQHVPLRLVVIWKTEIRFNLPAQTSRAPFMNNSQGQGELRLLGIDWKVSVATPMANSADGFESGFSDGIAVMRLSSATDKPTIWLVQSRAKYL